MKRVRITQYIALAIACGFCLTNYGSESFSIHHLEHRSEWRSARYLINLTGGEFADALVINVDRENNRVADLYRLTPDSNGITNWQHEKTWKFDEDVIGFDVLRGPTGRRLLIARIDAFYLLDLETMEEHPLIELPAIFRIAPFAELPRLSITNDLNDDKLSDLTIPDFDGYWIAIQGDDGSFNHVQKLPVKPALVTGMAWSYRQRQIYELDFDGDGRDDLGFWDRGNFIVYLGLDNGFSTDAIDVDIGLDIQADESLFVGMGPDDDSVAEESDEEKSARTLERFSDFNGDKVIDALVLTMNRSGLFDFRSTYDFHFGSRINDRTVFDNEPNATIGGSSMNAISHIEDFNNDGAVDVVSQGAKLSVGAIVRFLLTRSIAISHDFYLMEDGDFSADPTRSFTSRIRFDFSKFDVDGWNMIDIGDMDGNGLKDLIVSELNSNKVSVHYGKGDSELFEKHAVEINLDRSMTNVEMLQLRDLNNDDKDDILIFRKNGLTSIVSH